MKRFIAKNFPLFILGALCLAMAFASESFRQPSNLQSVALRTCFIAVMAIGQLLVILTAGIDLSVGSVAALSGMVTARLVSSGEMGMALPWPVGIAGGLGVGLLCGLCNGVLVAKGRIPPFIATLGMMMIARGATYIISDGKTIFNLPPFFSYLGGKEEIAGYSGWWVPVLLVLVLTLVFIVMLTYTRFGRAIYATGGNLAAARLSGLPVDWVRIRAYALCSLMAALSGIMLDARTSVATANAAEMAELEAIAACVIGGASLMGGEGGAGGALAGALIMYVLVNFCNLNGISVHWQRVLVGSLIIALVYYDSVRKRKAGLLKDG
jgi:ribose/xylose/arabinose/galactoside ABC-type transport system permease subunit